jgi:nicotinamidase-related amidase|tara:strand:+ start:2940 stop:3581 length:642 start_codon:yes stop_codon:yes gene_type:complete
MIDLGVNFVKPAVIAIDCHRGHLDPEVATMPAPPDVAAKLVDNNKLFMERCRAKDILIVHLVTAYRDVEEIRSNPRWRALADDPNSTRKNVERHNLIGSPGLEIMPGLCDPSRDMIVDVKKRYDCFQSTDLDFVLRSHGINTLLVTGINTNSCVLATVCAANVRDYAAVVVEDCVDTMDGPDLHDAALQCIRTAFGWVMTAEDTLRELSTSNL